MTYNNPVFVEQCKRKNIDFDKLNTGWVEQKILDEKVEEEEQLDDDFDEDDFDNDFNDDEEFKRPPIKKDFSKSSTRLDNDSSVSFKFKGNKEDIKSEFKPKDESPSVSKPADITSDDIDKLVDDLFAEGSSNDTISTREKLNAALSSLNNTKPKIKLKSSTSSQQQKIKLNIKKK